MMRYRLYGITLESDFPFTWPLVDTSDHPDVVFTCTSVAPLDVDWESATAVHAVAVRGDEDRPDIAYHVLPELDVVRIADVADHYVWPDQIICHLHVSDLEYLVEIQLLGMVLALWLERRGTPTLHASAAVVDGSTVAFLGSKGGGKTTAATALIAAGHPMLVDDLLALAVRDGEDAVWAQPGYPMLRLWPEQIEVFVDGDPSDLPMVHPAFRKRRVDVGGRIGSFQSTPAPLSHVYIPVREVDAAIKIERLSHRNALLALVRDSFLSRAVHGLGLAGPRLASLVRATERLEVSVLHYPDGFDRLNELVEAVERDVARG